MTKPCIILINPQLGENIGMVARAMLNCGLTDLRIVNPRDGWPSDHAIRAASGALEKGVIATVFDTPQQAVADLHKTYATTARPRDMIKQVFTPSGAIEQSIKTINDGQKVGIVFGAERTGLQNEDIALSTHVITIPLNPDFSSLNLAQAVLLVAYEWMKQNDETPSNQTIMGKTDIATSDTIQQFNGRLIDELSNHGFFRSPDLRPTMERNITNLITRQSWTDQDIQTLHGILSAFVKGTK